MGAAALAVRELRPTYPLRKKTEEGSYEPPVAAHEPGGEGSCEPSEPVQLSTDPDRVEALADEVVGLAAHLHAGRARLLALLSEFDALEGWRVQWWGWRAVFTDPRGRLHLDGGWEGPEAGRDPVGALVQMNRLNGADPDPMTLTARWKRERDVPDEVWLAAHEAGLAAAEQRATRSEAG